MLYCRSCKIAISGLSCALRCDMADHHIFCSQSCKTAFHFAAPNGDYCPYLSERRRLNLCYWCGSVQSAHCLLDSKSICLQCLDQESCEATQIGAQQQKLAEYRLKRIFNLDPFCPAVIESTGNIFASQKSFAAASNDVYATLILQ